MKANIWLYLAAFSIGNKRTPIDADLVVESEAPANCTPQPPRAPARGSGAKTGAAD
jgi:hypothetical protein